MSTYFVEMRNMERDAALAEAPTKTGYICLKCKETGVDEKKSKGTFAEAREHLCDCKWGISVGMRMDKEGKSQKK